MATLSYAEGIVKQVYEDSGSVILENGDRYNRSSRAENDNPHKGAKVRLGYTIYEKTGKPYWQTCETLSAAPQGPSGGGSNGMGQESYRAFNVDRAIKIAELQLQSQLALGKEDVRPIGVHDVLTIATRVDDWCNQPDDPRKGPPPFVDHDGDPGPDEEP